MIWLLLLLLAGVLLYLGIMLFNAAWEAKSSPRVPMFLCDKHGAIPDSVLLHLEGASEKPIPYCPFCWRDRAQQIKEQGLPKVKVQS